MIKGKTSTGFEFELDENVMDNMELVRAIAEMNETGNPLALDAAMKMMLGAEQYNTLCNHLRTEDGRVPVSAVSAAFAEVVKAAQEPGKN